MVYLYTHCNTMRGAYSVKLKNNTIFVLGRNEGCWWEKIIKTVVDKNVYRVWGKPVRFGLRQRSRLFKYVIFRIMSFLHFISSYLFVETGSGKRSYLTSYNCTHIYVPAWNRDCIWNTEPCWFHIFPFISVLREENRIFSTHIRTFKLNTFIYSIIVINMQHIYYKSDRLWIT